MTEANSKYGADMAHIILKEEELPFPPIKLAKPRTTLADINAAKDETKKELEAQRELETAANLSVFNQRNNDQDKQVELQKKDIGKLCGIIKGTISDVVKIKSQEDPKFDDYQLGDPMELLKQIKKICMMYKGDKYICLVILNSIKQLANTTQGFK